MFKRSASKSNWNLEVLVFMEGGKPETPEKNPRNKEKTNNKLNPHETASMGFEPGVTEVGPGRARASSRFFNFNLSL